MDGKTSISRKKGVNEIGTGGNVRSHNKSVTLGYRRLVGPVSNGRMNVLSSGRLGVLAAIRPAKSSVMLVSDPLSDYCTLKLRVCAAGSTLSLGRPWANHRPPKVSGWLEKKGVGSRCNTTSSPLVSALTNGICCSESSPLPDSRLIRPRPRENFFG